MVHKLAVSLEESAVRQLDRLVREGQYPNRSKAVQSALQLLIERDRRTRLARELAKLNPKEEQAMAEEGLRGIEWPEY